MVQRVTHLIVPSMRLKRQSEIAIGILTACAQSPLTKHPAQHLAQEVGATRDHAYQVVALLVRNGFLTSDRGPGGGLRLARDPKDIKLADVLRITQPDLDSNAQEPEPGTLKGQPLLDGSVAAASSFLVRLLDRITVADLVASPDSSAIACLECSLVTARPARERLMRLPVPQLSPADDSLEPDA
ncbi:RrF2 family transcriptional regulator [Agrobacterium vitis]|uniref:RrF2 family transcriptional regulator n=1 Tax=Agrobacterium vitis TaxID=373 RepID=UPI002AC89ACE|nr:Rrf2 family transcriptional regulator [Agrobacterium vitis]